MENSQLMSLEYSLKFGDFVLYMPDPPIEMQFEFRFQLITEEFKKLDISVLFYKNKNVLNY